MSPGDSNERAKHTHLKLSLVENGLNDVHARIGISSPQKRLRSVLGTHGIGNYR